jgi:hypothetical protein
VEIDPVLHDEVLVDGMKHLGVDRRNNIDCKIVCADDAGLLLGQPFRGGQA